MKVLVGTRSLLNPALGDFCHVQVGELVFAPPRSPLLPGVEATTFLGVLSLEQTTVAQVVEWNGTPGQYYTLMFTALWRLAGIQVATLAMPDHGTVQNFQIGTIVDYDGQEIGVRDQSGSSAPTQVALLDETLVTDDGLIVIALLPSGLIVGTGISLPPSGLIVGGEQTLATWDGGRFSPTAHAPHAIESVIPRWSLYFRFAQMLGLVPGYAPTWADQVELVTALFETGLRISRNELLNEWDGLEQEQVYHQLISALLRNGLESHLLTSFVYSGVFGGDDLAPYSLTNQDGFVVSHADTFDAIAAEQARYFGHTTIHGTCPACAGSGQISGMVGSCPRCSGSGALRLT